MRSASASSSSRGVSGCTRMASTFGPLLQKVKYRPASGVTVRGMPRPYGLPGPVARSLEVVGDRWTLLLIRELLLGPARYGALARALPGIPSNLLAERLRLLEDEAIAARTGEREYELTDKGRDLAPVLAGLAVWGQ